MNDERVLSFSNLPTDILAVLLKDAPDETLRAICQSDSSTFSRCSLIIARVLRLRGMKILEKEEPYFSGEEWLALSKTSEKKWMDSLQKLVSPDQALWRLMYRYGASGEKMQIAATPQGGIIWRFRYPNSRFPVHWRSDNPDRYLLFTPTGAIWWYPRKKFLEGGTDFYEISDEAALSGYPLDALPRENNYGERYERATPLCAICRRVDAKYQHIGAEDNIMVCSLECFHSFPCSS